jgi:PTS system nitrogen regulatory IIA component
MAMIDITPFFSLQRTIYFKYAVNLTPKKIMHVIGYLSHKTNPQINISYASRILSDREKLGSTYVGYGIAIPHGRIAGLKEPIISLISLKNPISFSGKEDQKANLFFGLLIPETKDKQQDPHVKILATLAEKLKNERYRHQLSCATNNEMLYSAAIDKIHT